MARVVPLLCICSLRLLCPVIPPNLIDGFDFVPVPLQVTIVCMLVRVCLAVLCEAGSVSWAMLSKTVAEESVSCIK